MAGDPISGKGSPNRLKGVKNSQKGKTRRNMRIVMRIPLATIPSGQAGDIQRYANAWIMPNSMIPAMIGAKFLNPLHTMLSINQGANFIQLSYFLSQCTIFEAIEKAGWFSASTITPVAT